MELSDLTTKRREHLQSCRDNNDNSHEIIASLYSDASHFIYELLQNADDAGASEVKFCLSANSLSVTHNGKKLFDFSDVEAITTVNSSTKKHDVNLIGKFGAGFKSVFAITATPRIYSGKYHFRIIDFIVPEEIEPQNSDDDLTKIILPFNTSNISPNEAYKLISSHLLVLESEILLFLKNIKVIHWSTESHKGYYKSQIKDCNACLISHVDGTDCFKKYFLCQKDIKIDNSLLHIAVAYLLNEIGGIAPVHNSKLFVFFPTNERTGLSFIVHAPYKTTPNRETIPFEDDQNRDITKEISILIAESIKEIKKIGLLNVDFLSILPIDSEQDHALYKSAFSHVKSMMLSDSLLPTSNGGYERASDAILARESELTNLLQKKDCLWLFKRKSWLSTDITIDRTKSLRSYLILELEVPEITMQKFCSEITEEFIKTKSDDWLVKFYSIINKSKSLYESNSNKQKKGILRKRPIIRLEDNSHVCPENDSGDLQVYLPANGKSKFKTVKSIFAETEESFEFLKSLGLEAPNKIAEIKEFIIPKYQGNHVEDDEYTDDVERVFSIWEQSDVYRKREIIDLLRNSKFIRCRNQKNEIVYQVPLDVYFPTDRISAWFDKNTIDEIYFFEVPFKLLENKREFFERLGVRYNLIMFGTEEIKVDRYGWYEKSVNGFNPNFDIHGLEFSLKSITFERSKFLWEILLQNINKLKGYIATKTNHNHSFMNGEEKISKAMSCMNNYSWLYNNKEDVITLPINEITLDDISNEYKKDDDNVEKLIRVLGLKLDEVAEFEERTGKKVISKEDFELLQRIKLAPCDNDNTPENVETWEPEVDPDDAEPITVKSGSREKKSDDLSGQNVTKLSEDSIKTDDGIDQNKTNKSTLNDRKTIGYWGESLARKFLEEKYSSCDVIWLNDEGNVGKGYDFVIKKNGEDIAYYEIKSKTDASPQLFQVSGTQWNWAKRLYNDKKGKMYFILVISNAGTKQPLISEINDPVELWKSGNIYADPVNIEL